MKKNILVVALSALFGLFASPAFAVIDVSAATAGIADAQAAMLAVLGALMTMTTVLFGVTLVYGFLKRKTGA